MLLKICAQPIKFANFSARKSLKVTLLTELKKSKEKHKIKVPSFSLSLPSIPRITLWRGGRGVTPPLYRNSQMMSTVKGSRCVEKTHAVRPEISENLFLCL